MSQVLREREASKRGMMKNQYVPIPPHDRIAQSAINEIFSSARNVVSLGIAPPDMRLQMQYLCFHGRELLVGGPVPNASAYSSIALTFHRYRLAVHRRHLLHVKRYKWRMITVTHSYFIGRCKECSSIYWTYQGVEYRR